MKVLESSEHWDYRPIVQHYADHNWEMFTRTALAAALNRSVETIRSLEYAGVLCHPPCRMQRGWWLYTRSQIEDLIQLATEERVIDPDYRRTFSDRFVTEARKILRRRPGQDPRDRPIKVVSRRGKRNGRSSPSHSK